VRSRPAVLPNDVSSPGTRGKRCHNNLDNLAMRRRGESESLMIYLQMKVHDGPVIQVSSCEAGGFPFRSRNGSIRNGTWNWRKVRGVIRMIYLDPSGATRCANLTIVASTPLAIMQTSDGDRSPPPNLCVQLEIPRNFNRCSQTFRRTVIRSMRFQCLVPSVVPLLVSQRFS
jgi:hypothetical protein